MLNDFTLLLSSGDNIDDSMSVAIISGTLVRTLLLSIVIIIVLLVMCRRRMDVTIKLSSDLNSPQQYAHNTSG